MNKLIYFRTLATIVACLALALPANAYSFEQDGIYYNIIGDNTVELTYKDGNFNSYSGTMIIPATVTNNGTTYTVTAIGRSAFRNCTNLTSVGILATIESIGYAAFFKCTALTSLSLPFGLQIIEDQAFRETGLTQITIPNTVTSIGEAAFYMCSGLTQLTFPNSVTSLGTLCCQNCNNLTTVTLGNGLTEIPDQCFALCESLSSITIPSSVKTIGDYAFYYTAFTSFIVPQGIESIGYNSFGECMHLTSIKFPASLNFMYEEDEMNGCSALAEIIVDEANTKYCTEDNVLYDKQKTKLIRYAPQKPDIPVSATLNVTTIADGAFADAANAMYIIIGDRLTHIGYNAFARCSALRSFIVNAENTNFMSENGVLYTKNNGTPQSLVCYPAARPYKHYSVPNGVDTIKSEAFNNTSLLESVYIPQGIKEVESFAFDRTSMKRLVIDEGLSQVKSYAFYENVSLQSVYLPSTITSIGEQAFIYSYDLSDITFAGTTPPTIDIEAFYAAGIRVDECNAYVPASAVTDYQSHNWNSNYFSLNINPISPISSGDSFTADSLMYEVIDNNLNVKVTDVTSPNIADPGIPPKLSVLGNLCTVTMLADHALANCTKMVRAEVPFTVSLIDSYAFYGSTNIETMILNEGVQRINQFALSNINKLPSLNIPASVDSIVGTFVTNSQLLSNIYVHNGNTKYCGVDGVLFTKDKTLLVAFPCAKDGSYTVPDGTRIIGNSSFRGAIHLQELVMPKSLRTIQNNAFFGCTSLESINVPNGVTTIGSGAFSHCSSVSSADLPATLTELGYNAFYNVPDLTSLTVRATTPPTCEVHMDSHSHQISEPFISDHYANVELIVPTGCAQAYRQANIWKKFINISEADFPEEFIRGDVNCDGAVTIGDVTTLIDYLLGGSSTTISLSGADVNEDGNVSIGDVTALIDYLLSGAWPEPTPIDMWYLIGDRVGSNPWENNGTSSIGRGLIPLYPVGEFDENGKGELLYVGYFGANDAVMLIHHPGSRDDCWGMHDNGIFAHGGEDIIGIPPGNDGYYNIILNTKTDKFYFYPYSLTTPVTFNTINIVGGHSGWVVTDPLYNMTPLNTGKENHNWIFRDFTVTSDNELKFAANNNWDDNWGEISFPYGRGLRDGRNIPVQKGTYDVFFNDITGDFNFIKK